MLHGVDRAGSGGHVFLCYSREDSARVDALESRLRLAGIPVWRDTAELWPGQDWRGRVRRAIGDGALFLACFSAQGKGYQNEELVLAAEERGCGGRARSG
jgi:TIR domain